MRNVTAIDGDIILYSVGFASEDDPISHAKHSVKSMIERIKTNTGADDVVVMLSGPDNFRDDVATMQPYKGNRKEAAKPKNYRELRDYMLGKYDCLVSIDVEADDDLGRFLTAPDRDFTPTCASIDKDLNMIPGRHYNWLRDENYEVTEREGQEAFITQLLSGDGTDNIPGLFRIAGKRATKKVKEYCLEPDNFPEMFDRVLETYKSAMEVKLIPMGYDSEYIAELTLDAVEEIGHLLWIQRYGYPKFTDYLEDCVAYEEETRKEAEGSSD